MSKGDLFMIKSRSDHAILCTLSFYSKKTSCIISLILCHIFVCVHVEGFEIPDADSEKLMRPRDIVQYIADKEDISG